jgi:hypothetical protein
MSQGWAASRRRIGGAVLGTTAGLTVAAFWDWSDDAGGLYGIGVGLVMVGTFAVTAGVSAVVEAAMRGGRGMGRRVGA